MSDDLISRRALLRNLKHFLNTSFLGEITANDYISVGEIAGLIKDAPTAYDVDNTVERMKEIEKETLIKTEELYKDFNLSPDAIFAGSNSVLVTLRKCIAIVKSGGVEND